MLMFKKVVRTLFIIIVLNFFLPRFLPGDPFTILSVEDGFESVLLSDEQIEIYKSYYGFNKPLPVQFFDYLKKLIQFDLGTSIYYKKPVTQMVLERMGWTMALVLFSTAISTVFGVLLGAFSAYSRAKRKRLDTALLKTMTILSEIPDFLIGLILLFVFAAKLRWFPLSGGATPFLKFESFNTWLMDYLHHLALPCIVLAISSVGDFYLLTRQSVIGVLNEPYIMTAKAKGLKKWTIIISHALRNAWQPIFARVMMRLGMLLGGAILVENVFAYPGVGKLLREAVAYRDYILIQGVFFYVALAVLFFNTAADMIYKRADGRIKL